MYGCSSLHVYDEWRLAGKGLRGSKDFAEWY